MQILLNKLNHALTTKDWRLVEEALEIAKCIEWGNKKIHMSSEEWINNTKNFKPRNPVFPIVTMQQMMVQRESD